MGTTTTFPCPSCGKRMQACAPKPERIPGGVIRNRRCLQCGYRVKTKEVVISEVKAVSALRSALRQSRGDQR